MVMMVYKLAENVVPIQIQCLFNLTFFALHLPPVTNHKLKRENFAYHLLKYAAQILKAMLRL